MNNTKLKGQNRRVSQFGSYSSAILDCLTQFRPISCNLGLRSAILDSNSVLPAVTFHCPTYLPYFYLSVIPSAPPHLPFLSAMPFPCRRPLCRRRSMTAVPPSTGWASVASYYYTYYSTNYVHTYTCTALTSFALPYQHELPSVDVPEIRDSGRKQRNRGFK